MSRSLTGSLLGKAASAEKHDQTMFLYEDYIRRQRAELKAEMDRLMNLCIDLEGEQAFCEWWDDEKSVPNFARRSEWIKLLEAHLKELSDNQARALLIKRRNQILVEFSSRLFSADQSNVLIEELAGIEQALQEG